MLPSNAWLQWAPRTMPASDNTKRGWGSVHMSRDGMVIAASTSSTEDYVYLSTDGGATWSQRGPVSYWGPFYVNVPTNTMAIIDTQEPPPA